MRPIALLLVVLLATAGCATAPEIPPIESKRGDRVGIVVDIAQAGPVHSHIGTTVFNNFNRKYPYSWNLDAAVAQALGRSLASAGFTPVDLEAQGLRYDDVTPLVLADGDKWKVAPGKEQL